MGRAQALEDMLARGQDSALLRFGLGNAWLDEGDAGRAAGHLREAVRQDPQYSAAWKLLGKALTASGEIDGAISAFEQGLAAAGARGDAQAGREMRVLLRRLRAARD
ncbi:MAG: tetratricopeptide repeat protein [Gammaproteobacteria bacterium]|nr:tetratricopeptide repeat protein [Gammaproteobacteria bacterium]